MSYSKVRALSVPRMHTQMPQGRKGTQCCERDEGGPLGAEVQALASNHLTLRGSRVQVVSGEEKARCERVRYGSGSRTQVNRRRRVETTIDDIETGESECAPGGAQAGPADDLGGVRHRGGGSLIPARTWNVGTCRPDGKGSDQVGGPHEIVRTEAGHRGGGARSSVEPGERRGSKGAPSSRDVDWPTGDRRSR